ncbi:hypothetical protein CXF93_05870 [Moritella sp. Urea-trap-13]|nr:hypothetical protein CXF93_05870 [Moritella sp. Urea-trap-13]
MEILYLEVTIKFNHDTVVTPFLKHLAKISDYFLFCNKSAAHQAYCGLKSINKDILYPDGKG